MNALYAAIAGFVWLVVLSVGGTALGLAVFTPFQTAPGFSLGKMVAVLFGIGSLATLSLSVVVLLVVRTLPDELPEMDQGESA